MKVLIISPIYPVNNSYSGIYVKRQVESIENEGVEIIKVVKYKQSNFAYIPFILQSLFYLLFKSYDLVHAHYGFHSAFLPAVVKRKPLVTTFHGSDALKEPFRNILYCFLQKFTILHSDHIIAVSNNVKDTLVSVLNANPDKISVISCGVDTSMFRPLNKIDIRKKLGIAEDTKIVLFVGKICYMKGTDVLYKCAFALPNVLFVLVGDGPLKSDIKNCKFVGPWSNEEMPRWMNAADILVLPSRSEGTPVVLLEALSCGTPVISSNVGGCPDLVNDGQIGYLIPVDNASMLQEKIRCLLNNDDIRNSMGIQGGKDMIDKYDNKEIAQKIKRLYKDTINLR